MEQRRIAATELEFGAAVIDGNGAPGPLEGWTSRTLVDRIPYPYAGLDDRLKNGARFYMDIGNHPEYATPEDDSIMGTVANEIAGDRIVYATMQAAVAHHELPGFALNRRVADHKGNVWGYHENYSCARDNFKISPLFMAMALHVATRNIYAGAGTLLPNGNFVLAQKAPYLTYGIAGGTTNTTKPLINTRDEPHADKARFGRVHVVGGDPNMSPWATMMKLGTTSLVADVVESGYQFDHLFANDYRLHQIAKTVATDLTMRRTVELATDQSIRPIDIQYELLGTVTKAIQARDVELTPEKRLILSEWERALNVLQADPFGLKDRADWPQRYRVLQRRMGKYGIGPTHPNIAYADLRWDSLHPDGFGVQLRQTLWQQWMPDEALIKERMTTPPQTTRAAVRGRFINYVLGKVVRADHGADWSKLTTSIANKEHIELNDPFETSCPRLEQLMRPAA